MAREPRRPVALEGFFAALAIVSLLIGISRIGNPAAAPVWIQAADVFIAGAFFVDWVMRVWASDGRWRYAATHSWEVIFFIPYTLLPNLAAANILRGARLFRFLRVLRYGRYVRLGAGLTRLPRRVRQLQRIADHAQLVSLVVAGVVTVALGAAGLMLTEGQRVGLGAFWEALWWSLSLFTTVAYAVPEPTTQAGHVVSAALMVAGVAYVGIFTASLASAILRTGPEPEPEPGSEPGSE